MPLWGIMAYCVDLTLKPLRFKKTSKDISVTPKHKIPCKTPNSLIFSKLNLLDAFFMTNGL